VDLTQLVRVVSRRWRLFLIVLVACVAGAAAAAWLQTPIYQTSAILVATTGGDLGGDEGASREIVAGRATTLSQFATTAPVLAAAVSTAARETGLPERSPTKVEAQANGVTPFLTLVVSDPDPRWAQAVANAYVTSLPLALQPIDPTVAAAARDVQVLSPAALPTVPTSPNKEVYLALGLFLGTVLAVGVVVLREALDRQVHDAATVGDELDLPVLGTVPLHDARQVLPIRSSPNSPRAEAYRAVQANLASATPEGFPRVLIVTSTSTGEGTTTLAANLALALAGSGRRVVLVDANLRAPASNSLFDLPAEPGLVEVLAGTALLTGCLQPVDGTSLYVLSAGRPSHDPVQRLTSERMGEVLSALEQDHDTVIIDTPPVLPVADALFLAPHASAVVLVARESETSTDKLQQARDALRRVRAPLLGVVINGTSEHAERLPASRRQLASQSEGAAHRRTGG
jgi:succinoglycan biosynthesis transport protein ExoP